MDGVRNFKKKTALITSTNDYVWIGETTDAQQHDKAVFLLDETTGVIAGSVSTPRAIYDILIRSDGKGEVHEELQEDIPEEINHGNEASDREGHEQLRRAKTGTNNGQENSDNGRLRRNKNEIINEEKSSNGDSLQKEKTESYDVTLQSDTPTYTDVIIAYTTRAMCYLATSTDTRDCGDTQENHDLIIAKAKLAIAQANIEMEALGLPSHMQQRLVHVYHEANYDEFNRSSEEILYQWRYKDGHMDDVHQKRDMYGGDLAALITYGTYAETGNLRSQNFETGKGFSTSLFDFSQ